MEEDDQKGTFLKMHSTTNLSAIDSKPHKPIVKKDSV
jgi:hypothetical protein